MVLLFTTGILLDFHADALPSVSSMMLFLYCTYILHCLSTVFREIKQLIIFIITFSVSRRPREMYCGHSRQCVCLCLSAAACPHYCTDPDVTWGSGRGCPLVVHCWADLQSVHGLRCYGNTTEMHGRA